MVPIRPKAAERNVVQQVPPFSPASRRGSTPLRKYSARHSLGFWFAIATVVVAVAVISILLLRHPKAPEESTAKSDSAVDFQPESPSNASNEASSDEHPPEMRPANYNSPPTGTRIEDDIGTAGHGTLTVKNDTDRDAWVRLSGGGLDQTMRSFFVQAHTSAHVDRVPQGSYTVRFTTGLDWSQSGATFKWRPMYSEFEGTFDYREQHDSSRIHYDNISVTLNPVPFGNVRAKTIARDEFLKGGHKVVLQ